MDERNANQIIEGWPEESKEAAKLVIDAYGEPAEVTESMLVWHDAGQWKRIVATKAFFEHSFPAPHIDAVESFIDYRVPSEDFSALAEFDGSVVVERTAGEVSARCHDEQANFLALNLMHDIVTGSKDVAAARRYYAKEFLDARRKQPTPYMEKLHFSPDGGTADPDERVLSDEQLQEAVNEGKA
jgi:alkylhydroperoxidase family enzyme